MNKIILECENGHQWSVLNAASDTAVVAVGMPCPICHPPEPTYGDLDVETVARWMDEIWDGSQGGNRLTSQARAVIRLAKLAHRNGQLALPEHPSNSNLSEWLRRIGKGEE